MQTQSIRSIKKLGVQNTLDFKVNHPDHNFYAEGIVVSNSHSIATSYTGALTVYLKYKYPLEFFTACLKGSLNKPDQYDAISQIQKELHIFGIKLLPPSLKVGNLEFIIENGNIRFGLNAIKGLATNSLNKLNNFKTESCNKFEMFQAAKQAGLGCGIMASLIMSGAMDEFVTENRPKLSFECLLFSKLKDKEKVYCISNINKYNNDLITACKDIINWTDNEGKKVARATRLATLRKETKLYQEIFKNNMAYTDLSIYWWEKELMGYSYTSTLKQVFSQSRSDIINLSEFKNLYEGEGGVVVCQIDEITKTKSRKGNEMVRIFVSDDSASEFRLYLCNRNLVAFYAEGKPFPKEKDVIAVKMSKGDSNDMAFCERLTVQSASIYTKTSQIDDTKGIQGDILPETQVIEPQKELNLTK